MDVPNVQELRMKTRRVSSRVGRKQNIQQKLQQRLQWLCRRRMQTDILPDRKETEESTEPEEEQKQKNSRWEKEPENVEMKLWAVGKDQAETGSLKDLLDGPDEELEEWKD